MKLSTSLILVLLAVGFGFVYKTYHDISASLPPPKLDNDAFWGPGLKTNHKPNNEVVPFSIQYTNASGNPIQQLRSILNKRLLLHPPLEGVGFQYGVNSFGLDLIVREWRDDYLPRWEEREMFLNQFPQFTTEIQGYNYSLHLFIL